MAADTTEDYLQKILVESEVAYEKIRAEHAGLAGLSQEEVEPSQPPHTLPKYLRLSILHDLLYYMVRGYSGDETRTHDDLLACLESSCELDDTLRAELPRLYSDHTSCYMFIPPLSTLHRKLPFFFNEKSLSILVVPFLKRIFYFWQSS